MTRRSSPASHHARHGRRMSHHERCGRAFTHNQMRRSPDGKRRTPMNQTRSTELRRRWAGRYSASGFDCCEARAAPSAAEVSRFAADVDCVLRARRGRVFLSAALPGLSAFADDVFDVVALPRRAGFLVLPRREGRRADVLARARGAAASDRALSPACVASAAGAVCVSVLVEVSGSVPSPELAVSSTDTGAWPFASTEVVDSEEAALAGIVASLRVVMSYVGPVPSVRSVFVITPLSTRRRRPCATDAPDSPVTSRTCSRVMPAWARTAAINASRFFCRVTTADPLRERRALPRRLATAPELATGCGSPAGSPPSAASARSKRSYSSAAARLVSSRSRSSTRMRSRRSGMTVPPGGNRRHPIRPHARSLRRSRSSCVGGSH